MNLQISNEMGHFKADSALNKSAWHSPPIRIRAREVRTGAAECGSLAADEFVGLPVPKL